MGAAAGGEILLAGGGREGGPLVIRLAHLSWKVLAVVVGWVGGGGEQML